MSWSDSKGFSRGTLRVMTSDCGCAVNNSRREFGSFGLIREGTYDLVVGNPPYQGTSKMQDAAYVARNYPRGKADLYAAFLERGLQLARDGGTSALLTMRNWMFIKQYH